MPQDFVAKAIIKAVQRLPNYPDLSVLDLSCGRGEILSILANEGCKVRGTHYRSDDYNLTDTSRRDFLAALTIDENVDLTRSLSYANESFNVIILSEVVEHLPSYFTVIFEAGRILLKEGHLILTTPNIARLHSRFHFFWSGTHKLIRRRVSWDIPPDQLYAYHINQVDFPLLHTLLYHAGLHIQQLGFTRFKIEHSWLLLFYPFYWIAAKLETSKRIENDLHRKGERDLFRWMLHPALLASEQLLIVAKKSAP